MSDIQFMRLALRLAQRGQGLTSPNPMVGAVLVKRGKIIGRGWHRRVGLAHAEIEALQDAQRRGNDPRQATLYVTLEPCCTHGRTPPCTDALIAAGIKRVVIGAVDPNPKHSGKGFKILKRAGIKVESFAVPRSRSRSKADRQAVADECSALNDAFNHWIVHRTPFVTVKSAMTLDGKIATASGESKWITSKVARAYAMKLRHGADAILVGVNTILADDPSLTFRSGNEPKRNDQPSTLRRIVLDSMARTPLTAKVVTDKHSPLTTIVVRSDAPKHRVNALAKRVNVMVAPSAGRSPIVEGQPAIPLRWLLKKLGRENVTGLLVEGGGEVNASFLLGGFAHRIAFFHAPKILGGRAARKAVAGEGATGWNNIIQLRELEWKKLGPDLLLTARL